MIKIALSLTELEAKMLADAIDNATTFLDEPSEFTGDWPRGERAALRRMAAKLRAALPPKEKTRED